jgi:single-strand DNA-binding protein
MIKLMVIGNLGRDALSTLVNGKNVINFSVAHSEKYTDAAGAPQERTTWVECAYWTEKLGIVPYLIKGKQVYVEGQPELRQYQKSDGTPGASLTLRVQSLQLVGEKAEGPKPPPEQHKTLTPIVDPPATAGGSEDLPF